jgi:hypothetical protein
MRLSLVVGAVTVALVGCGEAPEQSQEPAGTAGQAEEAALPDVARVVCGPGAPEVTTPAVRPQADGLRVEVVNETGEDLSVSILPWGGTKAPEGTSTQVVNLPPGQVSVDCFDPHAGDAGKAPQSSFDLVDGDGVWVSTHIECATGMGFAGIPDYVAGARGEPDPQAVAETALERYGKPGDLIEPAGYPESESPEYRLVRDGEVLAVVQLMSDGAGGWLESQVTGCESLQSD